MRFTVLLALFVSACSQRNTPPPQERYSCFDRTAGIPKSGEQFVCQTGGVFLCEKSCFVEAWDGTEQTKFSNPVRLYDLRLHPGWIYRWWPVRTKEKVS